jgi:hypothetical protein
VILLPHRGPSKPKSLETPCEGGKGPVRGRGAPPFPRTAQCPNSSSVILVTVPAPIGAGTIEAER